MSAAPGLLQQVSKLEFAGAKDRSLLLSAIRQQIAQASLLAKLPEKSIKQLLTVLYKCTVEEKQAWQHAKTASAQSTSEVRLSQLGQLIRDILHGARPVYTYKTVKTFLASLLNVLPARGDILFKPLSSHYLRACVDVLSYRPHIDHLELELWLECVNFCSTSIENLEGAVGDDKNSTVQLEVVQLADCLALLLTWHAADYTKMASQTETLLVRTSRLLLDFFQAHGKENNAYVPMAAILSSVLRFSLRNSREIALDLVGVALNVMALAWPTRSPDLAEQLLVLGELAMPIVQETAAANSTFLQPALRLLSHLIAELTQKGQELALEELALTTEAGGRLSWRPVLNDPLSRRKLRCLKLIASLKHLSSPVDEALPRFAQNSTRSAHNDVVKRVKLEEAPAVSILHELLFSTDAAKKLLGLQVIAIAVTLVPEGLDSHDIPPDSLVALLGAADRDVQNWACLAVAGCLPVWSTDVPIEASKYTAMMRSTLRSAMMGPSAHCFCFLASQLIRYSTAHLWAVAHVLNEAFELSGLTSMNYGSFALLESWIDKVDETGVEPMRNIAERLCDWLVIVLPRESTQPTFHKNLVPLVTLLIRLAKHHEGALVSRMTDLFKQILVNDSAQLAESSARGATRDRPETVFNVMTLMLASSAFSLDLGDIKHDAISTVKQGLSSILPADLFDFYQQFNRAFLILCLRDKESSLSTHDLHYSCNLRGALMGTLWGATWFFVSANCDEFAAAGSRHAVGSSDNIDGVRPETVAKVLFTASLLLQRDQRHQPQPPSDSADHLEQFWQSSSRLFLLLPETKSSMAMLPVSKSADVACLLLSLVARRCLSTYTFERNPILHCHLIDFLQSSIAPWLTDKTGGFPKLASNVFGWLVSVCLTSNISSAGTRVGLVHLMGNMLAADGAHVTQDNVGEAQSTRTTLLLRFKDSDASVGMATASSCLVLFQAVDQDQFDALYNDINQACVPHDNTQEGLAVRLTALSNIFRHCDALQSSVIVHLVEMSQFVEIRSTLIELLSALARHLQCSAEQLFTTFGKHILYSWLGFGERVQSFPYYLFGYASISDWYKSCEAELVSQLMSQGHLDQLSEVCSTLQLTEAFLVKCHLKQILVYDAISSFEGGASHLKHVWSLLGLTSIPEAQYDGKVFVSLFTALRAPPSAPGKLEKYIQRIILQADAQHAWQLAVHSWTYELKFLPMTRVASDAGYLTLNVEQLLVLSSKHKRMSLLNITRADVVAMAAGCLQQIASSRATLQSEGLCRLRFLLSLTNLDHLDGYPAEFILDALRHVNVPFDQKSQVCSVIRRIVNVISKGPAPNGRSVVQALLHVLSCAQDKIEACSAFVEWVGTIPLALHMIMGRPVSFGCLCLPDFTDSEQVASDLEALLDFMTEAFSFMASSEVKSSKVQVIHLLLARVEWSRQLRSTALAAKLLDFLGSDYVPAGDSDTVFLGRLRAQVWCERGKPASMRCRESWTGAETTLLTKVITQLRTAQLDTVLRTHLALANLQHEGISSELLKPYKDLFCQETILKENKQLPPPPEWSSLLRATDFDSWSVLLVQRINDSIEAHPLLRAIRPLLQHSSGFRQSTLPAVLLLVLQSGGKLVVAEIADTFKHMCSDFKSVNKANFEVMIGTLEMMRGAAAESKSIHRSLFKFNALDAAFAALHFGLLDDALQLLHDHWSESHDAEADRRASLQMQLYQAITEPDSFYALRVNGSISAASRLANHELNGLKMLTFDSALSSAGYLDKDEELSRRAQRPFRAMHIFNAGLSDAIGEHPAPDDGDFEAAWRLGHWSLPHSKHQLEDSSTGTHQAIFALHKHARHVLIEKRPMDPHVIATAYKVILRHKEPESDLPLVMAMELEDVLRSKHETLACCDLWAAHAACLTKPQRYEGLDGLLWSRQVMLNSLSDGSPGPAVEEVRVAQLHSLVEDYHFLPAKYTMQSRTTAAATAERIQVSAGQTLKDDLRDEVRAMFATVLWDQADWMMSLDLIQDVTTNDALRIQQGVPKPWRQIRNLVDLGLRMASAQIRAPQEILEEILLPAVTSLDHDHIDEIGRIYHDYAQFCHEQMTSSSVAEDSERMQQLCQTQQEEVQLLHAEIERSSRGGQQVKLRHLKELAEQSQEELGRIERAKNTYLQQSLQYYLSSFDASDRHDDSMNRCCSLWFANSDNAVATDAWKAASSRVPTHKFLPVIHQLLSRLTQESSAFQHQLQALVVRLAENHPFQVLYSIFAITASNKKDSPTVARRNAALQVLQKIKARSAHLKTLVSASNSCCLSYAKLARDNMPTSASKFELTDAPHGKEFLATMQKLEVPPLTLRIESRPSCDYSDLPILTNYASRITVANGNSRPKIVVNMLSDGSTIKELLKSGDDLRQDAIMQQVFLGVNGILKRNEETRRRDLLVRTYHVLPLGDKVGVIEFVPGTKSLNDFLPDLHRRYRPDDWDQKACREKMRDVADRSRKHRVAAYETIMQHCKPVMRHVFIEWHAAADRWFATQLAYTRSTAAMSILGWVIGLGDRHLSNVMIDQRTGEMVHIDLGICFEAGRLLKIPELVPFRLTRDVVDGMGIQGVEGIFKRCCEFTMDTLRKEKDSIQSILDILRYDPLYDWSISPEKQKKQEANGSAVDEGELTSRSKAKSGEQGAIWALLVVHQKLSKTLNATAITNDLIQQAVDPKRLAVIFCGWQPYY